MKNRFPSILTVLVLSLILVTGCNKDDDDTPAKTKTELLTASTWKYSSVTTSGVDASALFEDCELDNTFTFATAGTGVADEGATKCDSGDPQTQSFTWGLVSSETILHLSSELYEGTGNDLTITTLSSTQLVVTFVIDLGTPTTFVVTFIH